MQVEAGREFEIDVPRGHTTLAYVFEGLGFFDDGQSDEGQRVPAVRMVKFADGDALKVRAAEDQHVKFFSGRDSHLHNLGITVHNGGHLKELYFPKGSIVGAIVRDQQVLLPSGETIIEIGDNLVIFFTRACTARYSRMRSLGFSKP